jgi:hypothetical protein
MNKHAFIMAAKGLAWYVPGLRRISGGTGGTNSARYCYSVWLRHLVMAGRHGLMRVPESVAELGPGDSLGAGLAALLSGANRYYALDLIAFANPRMNLRILDELVELFRRRQPIPDQAELPALKPLLDSYDFPHHLVTQEVLDRALAAPRVAAIRRAIASPADAAGGEVRVAYRAPWHDAKVIEPGAVDLVFSQSVLQHVDDLETTYAALHAWLKADGITTHQIGFGCHGTAAEWNGHWAYGDLAWKIIRGGRPYLTNRQPHSVHVGLFRKHGFEIVCDVRRTETSGIGRDRLAKRFREMSDEDLTTMSAFIIAVKKA